MPVAFLVFAILLSTTMIFWPAAWREIYVAFAWLPAMRSFWQQRSNMFYRLLGVFCIIACLVMFEAERPPSPPIKTKTSSASAIK